MRALVCVCLLLAGCSGGESRQSVLAKLNAESEQLDHLKREMQSILDLCSTASRKVISCESSLNNLCGLMPADEYVAILNKLEQTGSDFARVSFKQGVSVSYAKTKVEHSGGLLGQCTMDYMHAIAELEELHLKYDDKLNRLERRIKTQESEVANIRRKLDSVR